MLNILLVFLLLSCQLLLKLLDGTGQVLKLPGLLLDMEALIDQALLLGYLGGVVHLGVFID